MAVTTPGARRGLTVLSLLTITALAGPGAVTAAPSATVAVPTARPGMDILVSYASNAAFARTSRAGDVRPVGAVPELRIRVFRANRGQEQKAMRALAAEAGVLAVESDVEVQSTLSPNDPRWRTEQMWQHDKVALRPSWDVNRGAAGTVVAVLDTGVDLAHPEFANRLLPGYDAYNGDLDPSDDKGHGTMSAGVASARGGNGVGVAGACWYCRILPVKVLNSAGGGYASRVTSGIVWAANNGADVINMSFGGFAYSQAMADAIAYARSKGVVVVASAGNEGNTEIFYPAAYPGVISVAAYDAADRPYSWSTRGTWVDLASPGCIGTTARNNAYANFCGTSASAPLVAGAIGVLRSAVPTATGVTIENAVLNSATPMSGVGRGRLHTAAALDLLGVTLPLPAPTTAPWASATPWNEAGGRVTLEAENGNRVNRGFHPWLFGTAKTGWGGTGYVMTTPDAGYTYDVGYLKTSTQLRFPIRFTRTGTYTVWVRAWSDDNASNSLHGGLDGRAVGTANRIRTVDEDRWTWTKGTMDGHDATVSVSTAGKHVLELWMREDGVRIDRIVLTRSTTWTPTGVGPTESARSR